MFTLARCRSSVSFNDGYTTIALCTWVRMHRYNLMAYLAVNRNGEELVFNDCPIYDRVEDTWKIPMLRWELVYDDNPSMIKIERREILLLN